MYLFADFGLQTLGGNVITLNSPLAQFDCMNQCKCEISAVLVINYPESTTSMAKQSKAVSDGVEATGVDGVQLF